MEAHLHVSRSVDCFHMALNLKRPAQIGIMRLLQVQPLTCNEELWQDLRAMDSAMRARIGIRDPKISRPQVRIRR